MRTYWQHHEFDTPYTSYMRFPKTFDVNKLQSNYLETGHGTYLVKIPRIRGRINKRKKNQNSGEYYIELILSQGYDPARKQNRNNKVIIETDFSWQLDGMMIPNDNYFEYFTLNGKLNEELAEKWRKEEQAREERKQAKAKAEEPAGNERATNEEGQDITGETYTETCLTNTCFIRII